MGKFCLSCVYQQKEILSVLNYALNKNRLSLQASVMLYFPEWPRAKNMLCGRHPVIQVTHSGNSEAHLKQNSMACDLKSLVSLFTLGNDDNT